ncbi:unnamed protein product, partial [Mesorhabditis belari]|uniref:Thyroglobulin type-1 domain-containing protein n=1 Tax=Mesorhabditis belari TaxID=2138241 RepID=A0AAF3EW30_9BILA
MKLLISLILFVHRIRANPRLCEVDGSCRACGDGRYSFYRCASQNDCYSGEICDGEFCCPTTRVTQMMNKQNESNLNEGCPDGSSWMRRCNVDYECDSVNEFCAEGKCCSVCSIQRKNLLEGVEPSMNLFGVHIPQCDQTEPRLYRRKQCLAGTSTCWCVNGYGRRIEGDDECEFVRRSQENPQRKAQKILEYLAKKNSHYSESFIDHGASKTPTTMPVLIPPSFSCPSPTETWVPCDSPCQASCEEPNTLPCPTPSCQPGCQCLPGFVRATKSPFAQCIPYTLCIQIGRPQPQPQTQPQPQPQPQQCQDPKRKYTTCGSSCPISCESRLSPRCRESCSVQGCFCQIPYILENGNDPLNSRCILPAECPQIQQQTTPHPTITASFPIQPFGNFGRTLQTIPVPAFERVTPPTLPPLPSFPTLPPTPFTFPTTTPRSINSFSQCADPLKEYQQCGSACPMGCDLQSLTPGCLLQCVPGCYCRSPYILLVSAVRQSSCVLPNQCPQGSQDSIVAQLPTSTQKPETLTTTRSSCSDPRKEWSECRAEGCTRSCRNLAGSCIPNLCKEGCVCREPYVLFDFKDMDSRCVLPSECESSCSDPKKEFITCGSACPLGCDNRNPRHCTPCEKGCFCKNGFVFKNSSNWRNSECISFDECPNETTKGTAFISESSTFSPTSVPSAPVSLEPPRTEATTPFPIPSLSPRCPSSTQDVGGKACIMDSECPNGQFCCRAQIVSLNSSPQRCACEDANAVYTACGTLCPEYCGQSSKPVCSSTCNPSCQCAPDYVRIRNEINAPCVKKEFCPNISNLGVGPVATMRDITPIVQEKDRFSPIYRDVATAHLVSPHSFVSGKFTFEKVTESATRVRGTLTQLPPGAHAVVMHQFGDVTDGCSRLGPVFMGSKSQVSALLGDIVGGKTNPTEFIRIVDWPVQEIIGRGVAIYLQSTTEWTLRNEESRPLACGMIGVSRR